MPSITKGLQYEGKQVALPYDVGPFVMFYNKDAFKAAGLKEPAIGWTTDDFMTDAKALTKPPKYGFWAQSDIGQLLPWVLSSSGKSAVNADGKLDVDNPEWHASAQWYTDLVSKEKLSAQIPSANSSSSSANQFLAGNAYMSLDGPWDLINAREQAKFKVGIAPMPAGASGSKTWSDGSGFGVTHDCKNPDEAFKAVSVMVSPEAETYLGNARPRLPGPDLHPELLVRGQQDPGRQAGHGRRPGQRDSVHHDSDLAAGRDHLRQAGRRHLQRSGVGRRPPQPDPGAGRFVT